MRKTLKTVLPLIVSAAAVSLLSSRINSKRESVCSATISPTRQRFSAKACE